MSAWNKKPPSRLSFPLAVIQSTLSHTSSQSYSSSPARCCPVRYYTNRPLIFDRTSKHSFIAASIIRSTQHQHLFANHQQRINATKDRSPGQQSQTCLQARLPTATARPARVPTHPVPQHPLPVRCLPSPDLDVLMTLTLPQHTLPPRHRAATHNPAPLRGIRATAANHQSSTMAAVRHTTRTRRRVYRMGATITREIGG